MSTKTSKATLRVLVGAACCVMGQAFAAAPVDGLQPYCEKRATSKKLAGGYLKGQASDPTDEVQTRFSQPINFQGR